MASFSFSDYAITSLSMDLTHLKEDQTLRLAISPSGEYCQKEKSYKLSIDFSAKIDLENDDSPSEVTILHMIIVSDFIFRETLEFEDIPTYFFSNSIAIIFPYIRAFVSNVTLMANSQPILLPTLNTMPLSDQLKTHTRIS
ncbi:MAG: hypothetical protein LIP03_12885 [Bacteroidales bacterium]|nr:hypothetical protein [Bacteroidales bacterium]